MNPGNIDRFLFLSYPSPYSKCFGRRLLGWMSATGSTQHDQEATLRSLFQSRLLGTQEMEDPHLKEKLGGLLQHCWCQS